LNGALDIKELRKVFTNSPKSAIFSDYWEMRNTILKIPIYIILFISYYITNLINKHFPTYSHDIENYDYDIISQSSSYIDLTASDPSLHEKNQPNCINRKQYLNIESIYRKIYIPRGLKKIGLTLTAQPH
jgi:hypothetical protein